jgi:hypothetical protein
MPPLEPPFCEYVWNRGDRLDWVSHAFAHKAKIYDQSQIFIAVYPDIEEHRQECLCYRKFSSLYTLTSKNTGRNACATGQRDTTASRAVEQLKESPPPGPLRYQGAERGVLNREGDTRYLCFTTLCQESIPAALSPRFRSLQWAATPKLTMIAGAGNFPSGSSRCESSLSQSNNSRRERRIQRLRREK